MIPTGQKWSDMMVHMIATPSPYTRDQIMQVKCIHDWKLSVSIIGLQLQDWKGMLDGGNFLKAGWVHNLKLHQFSSTDSLWFIIIGKVNVILHHMNWNRWVYLNTADQAFSEDVCNSPVTLGGCWEKGRDCSRSLHLHGWVRLMWFDCHLLLLVLFVYIYRLGEDCSHVAAVLSRLVRATGTCKKSGTNFCTSQECYWLPPFCNVSNKCTYWLIATVKWCAMFLHLL